MHVQFVNSKRLNLQISMYFIFQTFWMAMVEAPLPAPPHYNVCMYGSFMRNSKNSIYNYKTIKTRMTVIKKSNSYIINVRLEFRDSL